MKLLVKSIPMIKALIFDFDGLILDTETPEYHALSEIYREYGQELPITVFAQVVGSDYSHAYEPVSHLQGLTGKNLQDAGILQRMHTRRMELIYQNTTLPGVDNLVREAHLAGLKLAVASSSAHAWVDQHLARLGLFDFFDVIICKDDVGRIKPNPDLFLAAIQALDVQPSEAVIFEDSLNGIIAGQLAGIRVVAVPNPITEHLDLQGQTLRLTSLAGLTLEVLFSQLSAFSHGDAVQ
jgi:putative hydrolase of the HAD superfamily